MVPFFENLLQGTGHIQAGRHPRQRRHTGPIGRTVDFAQVHMRINDARHKQQPLQVFHRLGTPGKISADSRNPAVLHRHVHHIVPTVLRIHDVTVLKENIPHGFVLRKEF